MTFRASECDSLPLLKLLGKAFDINVTNARLYIKGLEMKIIEIVDVLKMEEVPDIVLIICIVAGIKQYDFCNVNAHQHTE